METTTSIATFSHLLNIKDKLFPWKNEIEVSKETEKIEDKYCSLFLEHSFQPGYLGNTETENIELVLAKKSQFTIPIRHIDWKFAESKLDMLKPINLEMPELLLVREEGCLIKLSLKDILSSHIEYLQLRGKDLKKALNTLVIQCVYADSHLQIVNAPLSLKTSLFEFHEKEKSHNDSTASVDA